MTTHRRTRLYSAEDRPCHPLLNCQSDLPRSLSLFRYAPERSRFSWAGWDPSRVRNAGDLPQYLILGGLDPATFEQSASGWSARWQGTEENTHFKVAYKADKERWEIRQTWRGLDGGFCLFSASLSLDRVITQALYRQFPGDWDEAAKSLLESTYQISLVEQPANAFSICGIPDGAFRTILLPVAASDLRPIQQRIKNLVEDASVTYPVTVEAKLVFQPDNYLEVTALMPRDAAVLNQSAIKTELVTHDLCVRETANNRAAARTRRREPYFLFIGLPFAGLTDFLSRMASANGPIRARSDPDLRSDLRPMVVPAAFGMQAERLGIRDKASAAHHEGAYPRTQVICSEFSTTPVPNACSKRTAT